jgi:hypothetical protein
VAPAIRREEVIVLIIKVLKNGEWVSFGSAANPSVINKYLNLARRLYPNKHIKVEEA